MKKILISLLLASPSLLLAQGSQVNTQSQKLVGMAGAGSALFIDESSMVYSPGALAKMESNAIQIGGSAIMYRSAFREAGATETFHNKFKISPPFGLYATFGPQGAWWKAGLAVYTPFGGSVDWGNEWPGRFSLNHLSMRAIYIQPTVSFKLTDHFSFGGGFVYNIGIVDLGRSIEAFHPDGRASSANLSGTGTGMGYNLGIHYNLEDDFALSINYRSKVNTKLEDGDAVFDVPGAIADRFPNTTFSAELPLPSSLNIGITFPISSRVDAALDASFINYSVYKELVFEYGNDAIASTRSEKKYENAFSAKAGIDYQVNDKLALRTGVGVIRTPVRSSHVYPETPDNDRIMLAGGLTYEVSPKWELNASYAFQHILARETTNVETQLSGSYKTYIHAPGLSIAYKW